MKWTKVAVCMLLLGLLSACGGGGGDGGQPPPNGAFTLSATSLNFTARQNDVAPASQQITVTLTGSGAAYAGAAYANGQTPPDWIGFSMNGSGSTYQLVVSIKSTQMAPGTYTTTFGVGTADSSGKVLQSQNVTVTLTVKDAQIAATATPNSPSYTFTYGASTATNSFSVVVSGAGGLNWTASSDEPWLTVPTGAQAGNSQIPATVNVTGLMPGTYQGHVVVVDGSDSANTASVAVSITVQWPVLTVSQTSITLGGPDGLTPTTPQGLTFSLNTGTSAYGYIVNLSTTTGGYWLSANNTTGTVSAAGTTVLLSGTTNVTSGTYIGQVTVTAVVGQVSVTSAPIPITFNLEANRIVVGAAGVGFSSTGSGSVLTRAVTVFSALGRTNTPWRASADQSWLSVTGSGVTGGAITLTANPSGLTDGTYFANVDVSSSDPTVENQETIRVGLYVSGATVTDLSLSTSVYFLAASPVEPIVFINSGGTSVTGYNVFTGTVDRTFPAVVTTAGVMVVSADGQRLYVCDQANSDVVELDASSGALIHTYDDTAVGYRDSPSAMAYVRPNGHSMIITPSSRSYDVTTHTLYQSPYFESELPDSYSLEASPDNSKVTTDGGAVFGIFRSALNGGTFNTSHYFSASTAQGAPGQACISADGQTLYTASGAPYNFYGTSMTTQQGTQVLPGETYPNSIACGWNGLVVGGASDYNAFTDVFVYNGVTGVQLAVIDSSSAANGRYLLNRGLVLSADDTRLITAVAAGAGVMSGGNEVRFQTLPPP